LDGESLITTSAISDAIVPLGFQEEDEHNHTEHIAINQFSAGRKTVLGLADDQTIWLWYQSDTSAIEIRFPELDPKPSQPITQEETLGAISGNQIDNDNEMEKTEADTDPYVPLNTTRVVSGWQNLSVYIRGHGILVFPVLDWRSASPITTPPFAIVDQSTYFRPPKPRRANARYAKRDETEDGPGEVTSHILLENFIVFTTDNGKVYASTIPQFVTNEAGSIQSPRAFEIPELNGAVEIQGSFRSFGVFKKSGEVIVINQDFLEACLIRERRGDVQIPAITLIPALQNSGVIQLSFGDYHYHALHTDGSITSYGYEPEKCGALGLSQVRGVVPVGDWTVSGRLLPHGYIRGRHVWFHHSQWEFEEAHAHNPRFTPGGWQPPDEDTALQQWMHIGEFSEWIEQKGSNWNKWPEIKPVDEDELGPFFAISIAAGGWSSGALVLVNDKVVDKIQETYETNKWQLERPVDLLLGDGSHWNWEARREQGDWLSAPPEFKFRVTGDSTKSIYGFPRIEEVSDS
jgi:SCF-associated factor 1